MELHADGVCARCATPEECRKHARSIAIHRTVILIVALIAVGVVAGGTWKITLLVQENGNFWSIGYGVLITLWAFIVMLWIVGVHSERLVWLDSTYDARVSLPSQNRR